MSSQFPPYPEGHEYYGAFAEETLTDGWCYGYITASPCDAHPDGCESGDGFAVAPDGTYAGLVWWTECPWEFERIGGSKGDLFGVFEVRFPRAVRSIDDLVFNFRSVLPMLKNEHDTWLAAGQPFILDPPNDK
jgi:hypothetical protein